MVSFSCTPQDLSRRSAASQNGSSWLIGCCADRWQVQLLASHTGLSFLNSHNTGTRTVAKPHRFCTGKVTTVQLILQMLQLSAFCRPAKNCRQKSWYYIMVSIFQRMLIQHWSLLGDKKWCTGLCAKIVMVRSRATSNFDRCYGRLGRREEAAEIWRFTFDHYTQQHSKQFHAITISWSSAMLPSALRQRRNQRWLKIKIIQATLFCPRRENLPYRRFNVAHGPLESADCALDTFYRKISLMHAKIFRSFLI